MGSYGLATVWCLLSALGSALADHRECQDEDLWGDEMSLATTASAQTGHVMLQKPWTSERQQADSNVDVHVQLEGKQPAEANRHPLNFFQLAEEDTARTTVQDGKEKSPLPGVPDVASPEGVIGGGVAPAKPVLLEAVATTSEAALDVAPAPTPSPQQLGVADGPSLNSKGREATDSLQLPPLPLWFKRCCLLGFVFAAILLAWLLPRRIRGTSAAADIRMRVEEMRTIGGRELKSMFALDRSSSSGDAAAGGGASQEITPGLLMRLQGRVVVVNEQDGKLVAPLSGRPCVVYSASVSRQRLDGVHQPPVAFHASSLDFAIEVEDGSESPLQVRVNSQDVLLFDMCPGRYACEETLTDASPALRSFVLAHHMRNTSASSEVMHHVDPGAKGLLEFRECALLHGQVVTCIGEVCRDRRGGLSLHPWRPILPPQSPNDVKGAAAGLAPTDSLSWKRILPWQSSRSSKGEVVSRDPLCSHVAISDDPVLHSAILLSELTL